MFVSMKNDAGLVKTVKVGFSWTALFFGGLPFFFRGLPLHGIIWVVLALFTFGISNLFLMVLINKQTAHYFLERGFKPTGEGWDVAGAKWGISK